MQKAMKKKVAAVQLASGSNVSANLLETQRYTEAAVQQGAELVVLPENFAFMGRSCNDTTQLREQPGDGPLQAFLSQLAARLGVWIVGGTVPLEAEVHGARIRRPLAEVREVHPVGEVGLGPAPVRFRSRTKR